MQRIGKGYATKRLNAENPVLRRVGRDRDAAPGRDEQEPDEKPAIGIHWTPFPGPQTDAYHSLADELLYGGAAGGGKSDLLLGVPLTHPQQRDGIIFRRQLTQMQGTEGILARSEKVVGNAGRLTRSPTLVYRTLPGGRTLQFGGMEHEGDWQKYQGQPHDYIGFDELTQFSESQYRTIIAWNRTSLPGIRTRVVSASNPPLAPEEEWIIDYWGPWLDPTHPDPAEPGELVWYIVVVESGKSKDVEVGRGDIRPEGDWVDEEGFPVVPLSRTFIPAKLEDNPVYVASGYRARLQGLPEPLRSRLLFGFDGALVREDPELQVIPTAWIEAAQARWSPNGRPRDGVGNLVPLSSLGLDVARGGADRTTLAPKYEGEYGIWFDEVRLHPGVTTSDGGAVAGLVLSFLFLEPGAGGIESPGPVGIDVLGVGNSPFDILRGGGVVIVPLNASAVSQPEARAQLGEFGFRNDRTRWWWRFREALDPSAPKPIALPPSRRLKAELAAARYTVIGGATSVTSKYAVEAKKDIKARLGRSPDEAEAVIYAFVTSLASAWEFEASGEREDARDHGF